MIIGTYTTLPNPTQLERVSDVVAIDIDALGGTKRLKISGDQLIFIVRFRWDGLTRDEHDDLVPALKLAAENYVLVDCPRLGGLTADAVLEEDQMYMTLLPNSNPSVQLIPGYADQTPVPSVIGEHWISYAISADMISYPMVML